MNFQNPYQGRGYAAAGTFVRPSTVFALDVDAKPPQVQNWNVGVQRSLFDRYVIEVRYVGAAALHLPRNVEPNPAVYGPGATAQNADRRRIFNVLNHTNFGLPAADLNSPSFGRILSAGSPRLMQFAMKPTF